MGFMINIFVILTSIVFYYYLTAETMNTTPREHVKIGGRKALVIGATGAVGSNVLKQLLESDEWSKVTVVGRREIPEKSSKLEQVITEMDAESLDATSKNFFRDVDVVFNCIGTTRSSAGSAEKFIEIEVGITEATAKIAKDAGVKHYSVVTAQGANPNAWAVNWIHPLLYVKTLGQKEKVVVDQKFPRTSVFKPGMLNRLDHARKWESIFAKVPLLSPIRVDVLASAMIKDAESTIPDVSKVEEPKVYEGNGFISKFAETLGFE